tara:strand:- start:569 stop:790 length:222 start_codon:yes stop_codon:yes gene_type:complete
MNYLSGKTILNIIEEINKNLIDINININNFKIIMIYEFNKEINNEETVPIRPIINRKRRKKNKYNKNMRTLYI